MTELALNLFGDPELALSVPVGRRGKWKVIPDPRMSLIRITGFGGEIEITIAASMGQAGVWNLALINASAGGGMIVTHITNRTGCPDIIEAIRTLIAAHCQ